MPEITFLSLPREVHVTIAEYCENSDLISLCMTSKWVSQTCLPVLYRFVDLELDRNVQGSTISQEYGRILNVFHRQRQLIRMLLSHPEKGKYIQTFRGTLYTPTLSLCREMGVDYISETQLWSAIESLTNVRGVYLGLSNRFSNCITPLKSEIPRHLFQSATSVTLVGQMQYSLAKSILHGITPATLKYLRLDMVQDRTIELVEQELRPGRKGQDGRIIAHGVISGLLTPMTGHCTALKALDLRRMGQLERGREWHDVAEDASYAEAAAFMGSVRGTLEILAFEQVEERLRDARPTAAGTRPYRIMDDRFQRRLLPTIVSGNWPTLKLLLLGSVRIRGEGGEGETEGLIKLLKATFPERTKVVVTI